jgi:NhaA family Na+:H+ antiporter
VSDTSRAKASPGDSVFTRFLHWEAAGSAVLLCATVVALAWANSPFSESYFHLVHLPLAVSLGGATFELSLQHWINDLLMAVFFFVVGLEIKRELVAGELSSPRKALLPVMGALGGLIAPAAIYSALNRGGAGADGWGVPMATDIAFAIGILAVFGKRTPLGLKVFVAALAIATMWVRYSSLPLPTLKPFVLSPWFSGEGCSRRLASRSSPRLRGQVCASCWR